MINKGRCNLTYKKITLRVKYQGAQMETSVQQYIRIWKIKYVKVRTEKKWIPKLKTTYEFHNKILLGEKIHQFNSHQNRKYLRSKDKKVPK